MSGIYELGLIGMAELLYRIPAHRISRTALSNRME